MAGVLTVNASYINPLSEWESNARPSDPGVGSTCFITHSQSNRL